MSLCLSGRWLRSLLVPGLWVASAAGCGVRAPLPDLAPTLSVETLRDIQRDPRLTADQRRAMIRGMLGLPDDAAGNRVAQFLVSLP